jgi:hypothetical protein
MRGKYFLRLVGFMKILGLFECTCRGNGFFPLTVVGRGMMMGE